MTFSNKVMDDAIAAELAAREAARIAAERVGCVDLDAVLDELISQTETLGGSTVRVPTGFPKLDQVLFGGVEEEEVTVVAGRPGSGKTVFCMAVAEHLALDLGRGVMIFTLEMSPKQLLGRMASTRSGVGLRWKQAPRAQQDKLMRAIAEIRKARIYIDDRPTTGITDLMQRVQEQHRRTPVSAVIVDQLQLIDGNPGQKDYERINDASKGLKTLAKITRLPIFVTSQVNRVEKQNNKVPTMGDLTGSGSIESNADRVIAVYRDAIANAAEDNEKARSDTGKFVILKNRSGPSPVVIPVRFVGNGGGQPRFVET